MTQFAAHFGHDPFQMTLARCNRGRVLDDLETHGSRPRERDGVHARVTDQLRADLAESRKERENAARQPGSFERFHECQGAGR